MSTHCLWDKVCTPQTSFQSPLSTLRPPLSPPSPQFSFFSMGCAFSQVGRVPSHIMELCVFVQTFLSTTLLFWAHPILPILLASKMSPLTMGNTLNLCSLCAVNHLQRWPPTGAPIPVLICCSCPSKAVSICPSPGTQLAS